jgi:uncharacterized protein YdeI (YjbR/CyaY-like superfamily)
MNPKNVIYLKSRDEWRTWLKKNHNKDSSSERGVWLIYYKKHTGKPSIPYNDTVEEALCFGWIDTTVKRIDDERYMQKFTPRNKNSIWSKLNKERAEKMIKEKKMAKAGLEKIEAAKKNGKWAEAYTSRKQLPLSSDLKSALMKNKSAWANFKSFADSYQNIYIGWITSAKRKETRKKRIKVVVQRSASNQKPGMM